jgi:hypothetical protein
MEEASKAARAEARKKTGSQTIKKDPAGNSNKPAVAPEAPVPAKTEPPRAANLFDSASEPAGAREPDATQPSSDEDESESDEDEEILREAYVEGEVEEGDEAA